MVFIIDRYYNVKNKDDAIEINDLKKSYKKEYQAYQCVGFDLGGENKGAYFEYYTNRFIAAVPNASINGGIFAQTVKSAFCNKKVIKGKQELLLLLDFMVIIIQKLGVCYNPHSQVYYQSVFLLKPSKV